MKRILLIILLLGMYLPLAGQAQSTERISLEGTVTDYDTKEPLPGSVVTIPQFSLWAVADDQGKFRITSVPTGMYDLEITYLGYVKLVYNVTVNRTISNLKFELKPVSLSLNEVVVTATKGNELNSTVRIDRQAMDHIQAKTIKSYMELLPGVMIENPNLNTASVISLRDIGVRNQGGGAVASSLNAFGTNVVVDGATMNDKASISNDGVTQVQASNNGFDTRQVSTDNIESIEVITGVASAEYGDMNSGAVIIRTKSGRTPLEFSAATDPSSKIFSIGKGLSLGEKVGFLNLNVNYATAYNDIRTDENAFGKESFSARYSNVFNKNHTPVRFNMSVSGFMTQGATKNDPDKAAAEEIRELKNYSMTFNANGDWQINKPWLTTLRYHVDYRFNNGFSRDYRQIGDPGFTRLAMVEGISIGERHDGAFMADIRNESLAAYANAKLAADISDRYGAIYNKFSIGLEWNNSGNRGRGIYYEGEQPVSGAGTGNAVRNIDARDYIPFLNTYNAFAEDKITLFFNQEKSSITLSAGARYTMIDTKVLHQKSVVDPRFNLKYSIIRNNRTHIVRELSVRGGWGIQSAMPTLQFMYNVPIYNDREVLAWSAYTSPYRPAGRVYETTIITPDQQINPDLKIQRSHNIELGVDFDIFGIKGSVVYFNDKINNAYYSENQPFTETYKQYSLSGLDDQISTPYISNGVLYIKDQMVPYVVKEAYRTPSVPNNSRSVEKYGVEYTLNFGQIQAIRTSVVLSGQYLRRKIYFGGDYPSWANFNSTLVGGENNPFVVAFAYGTGFYQGEDKAQLMSHLNVITHIPKLRLITSITIQGVLLHREQFIPPPDLYHIDANGNRVYGDYTQGWEDALIYRDPVLYMDHNKTIRTFDPALYNDPDNGAAFLLYRGKVNNRNYFLLDSFNPYFMGKIKVTKEIGKIAQISFEANNFTVSNPQLLRKSTEAYLTVNTEFYFGAELKLKF